jgi:hypothetical protein
MTIKMKKVYIAAPLGGDVPGNIDRAKEYARYALECGAAPVVPHFYALILDDSDPGQRALGLRAGQNLLWFCDEVWCFGDTCSPGMREELKLAKHLGITVRYFSRKQKIIGGLQFYETKNPF